MPKIEIDESEYNQLQALRGVAAKIVANPSARKKLEEAQKLVDPKAATPTLDAEAEQLAPINALRDEITKELKALKESNEDKERTARIAEIARKQASDKEILRRDHGYLDEGIKAVEKIMEEKGLLEVVDAVAIFERTNPPPAPITPTNAFNFADLSNDSTDKNIKELIATRGGNDQIADRMAREILADFRGQIGRR